MIINNEHNRTNVEASIPEALELIEELSKAVRFALEHGGYAHRTTNGIAASERLGRAELIAKCECGNLDNHTLCPSCVVEEPRLNRVQFKPSSFNVTVTVGS